MLNLLSPLSLKILIIQVIHFPFIGYLWALLVNDHLRRI